MDVPFSELSCVCYCWGPVPGRIQFGLKIWWLEQHKGNGDRVYFSPIKLSVAHVCGSQH